jgi:hypothetical protein
MNDNLAAYHLWRPAFEKVMDQRLYTLGWLDSQVWSGRAWFWGNERAGIVTELRHYPTGAIDIHGLIAAGDMAEIRDVLIPLAEEFARTIGCVGAIIESRDGWAKALKKNGYEPFQTAIRKELI